MTLPKKLLEKRDELAKTMGNRHANPVIRSMYPSKSRGQMAGEFAQLYSLGFSDACNLLFPEIEKLKSTIDCAAKYLESCGYNDVDQSEPELQMLQSFYKAMQSLEDFLGDKSEGGDE